MGLPPRSTLALVSSRQGRPGQSVLIYTGQSILPGWQGNAQDYRIPGSQRYATRLQACLRSAVLIHPMARA